MRRVKLGQICEVVSGGTPKTNVEEYWNGEFNWITPAEINDNDYIISDTKRKITQLAIEKKKLTLLPKGTVLLSSRAPIGKVAIAGKEMYCNQGFKNLICSDEICNEYLYWYLKSKKEYLNSLGRGATFKEISKKIVENIEIKLPEIEQQRKIVNKLKEVDKIIQQRKCQSRLLDGMVQSRFVEMFGDPVKNPLEWKVKKLKELSIQINSGNTPKGGAQVYVEKGITFFRSQNVWKDRLELEDIVYIDEQTHESMKRSSLKHGDILMTKTGRINTENSSLGRAALYMGKDDKANINGHVYFIRLKPEVNNKFILRILVSKEYRDLIRNVCVGGIDKRQLNKNHIENFPIICPPKRMIDSYISFVQQVNKSKFVIHKFLYCTTHNTKSIIKPRPNTKESGKIRGGKPHADEF